MLFHSECGHIIDRRINSLVVSHDGWKDYTHHLLIQCPWCEREYPYLKVPSDSVREDVERVVNKLFVLGCEKIHVPVHQTPVTLLTAEGSLAAKERFSDKSVRLVSKTKQELVIHF